MKRIYIDTNALITQTALAEKGLEAHGQIGYCYDAHDQSYALFVATDKETKTLRKDVNGKVGLNLRAQSKRKA